MFHQHLPAGSFADIEEKQNPISGLRSIPFILAAILGSWVVVGLMSYGIYKLLA